MCVDCCAFYDRAGIVDGSSAFVLHFEASDKQVRNTARSLGAFRLGFFPGVSMQIGYLPRKCRDSFKQGVVVCLTGLGERNLLVEMPYTVKTFAI